MLIQTLPQNDPRVILDHIFLPVPTSALAAPALPLKKVKRRNRSASTEPSRRSYRQAAKKSVAPVMSRTTHRLMQQLDLVQAGEPIGDVAMKKYADMFQGLLAPGAIAPL
jgi:hypothetical protein